MAKRRTLKRDDYVAKPFLGWNVFVDLIAKEKFDDMNTIQQAASLAFWYDSEVYNGGHLQYFENRRGIRLPETIVALGRIGAPCHGRVLQRAAAIWTSKPRSRIGSVEEFCQTASEGEFKDFDRDYHKCAPKMHELLKEFLKLNLEQFIDLI